MTINERVSQAITWTTMFRRAELKALELEEMLLDLGFYNVEFRPVVSAQYAGVRYPL